MKEKEWTGKEMFCGMPYLRRYFCAMDSEIKRFGQGEGVNPAVEKRKAERAALLQTVRNMDIEDLRVVQYVHTIKKLKPYRVAQILKKISDSVAELESVKKEIRKGEARDN